MGNIRPVIKRNDWQLSKHEFYFVYHYALQYTEWNDMVNAIASIDTPDPDESDMPKGNGISDTTFRKAVKISKYKDKMRMIENLVRETDATIYCWLLKGVTTEGCTYNYLKMVMNIPCGKNYYYEKKRKFYYLLSKRLEQTDGNERDT